jgi:hypothetical protein
MTLQELRIKSIELTKQYPQYEDQIRDLFFLAQDEIEDGGSEAHECELAISDMEYLIEHGDE